MRACVCIQTDVSKLKNDSQMREADDHTQHVQYIHRHMYECTYTYIYMNIYLHTYINIYIYIYIYVFVRVYVYKQM